MDLTPLDEATRQRFQNQRRRDTKPEIALRSVLHRQGLRFRCDRRPLNELRARADIVFGPSKVAVFVDGCFWHRCELHSTTPKNNREWWVEKLDKNVTRDRRIDEALTSVGWMVIRVWEHEHPAEAAIRIVEAVRERRPTR